jgi:hypothetical protein
VLSGFVRKAPVIFRFVANTNFSFFSAGGSHWYYQVRFYVRLSFGTLNVSTSEVLSQEGAFFVHMY